MTEHVYSSLREANVARQIEWCGDQMPDLSFRGNELAGEVGEACNVIKKLERERLGWRGSRDSVDHLADELADVVICTDLVAVTAGIDLDAAIERKFNATSEKMGHPHRLLRAGPAETFIAVDYQGCIYHCANESAAIEIAKSNAGDVAKLLRVDGPLSPAALDVLDERRRQVLSEGWTADHDDGHGKGEMAQAAAAYAYAASGPGRDHGRLWPWDAKWWKPGNVRRMLVKAAALLIAEIERLDRKALREKSRG